MAFVTSICVCRREIADSQVHDHRRVCEPYRAFNDRIAQQIMHKFCKPQACEWGEHKQERCTVSKDTILEDIAEGKWWAPVSAIANDGRLVGTAA